MRRGLAMLLALEAGCACSGLAGPTADRVSGHPTPTAAQVAAIALRADELRVASFGADALSGMARTVGGPAAELFERNWTRFQRLHEHLDVVVLTRALVHWSAASGVAIAVVATTGRQRVSATAGDTAWDNFADQWQYTVRWAGGWRVWVAVDLPPGQWWPA